MGPLGRVFEHTSAVTAAATRNTVRWQFPNRHIALRVHSVVCLKDVQRVGLARLCAFCALYLCILIYLGTAHCLLTLIRLSVIGFCVSIRSSVSYDVIHVPESDRCIAGSEVGAIGEDDQIRIETTAGLNRCLSGLEEIPWADALARHRRRQSLVPAARADAAEFDGADKNAETVDIRHAVAFIFNRSLNE